MVLLTEIICDYAFCESLWEKMALHKVGTLLKVWAFLDSTIKKRSSALHALVSLLYLVDMKPWEPSWNVSFYPFYFSHQHLTPGLTLAFTPALQRIIEMKVSYDSKRLT